MKLIILNHKYQYEILKLTQIFFPNTKIDMVFSDCQCENGEPKITTEKTYGNITVGFYSPEYDLSKSEALPEKDDEERTMASMLYDILVKVTGYAPKWGMLTGIRPSKLFRNFSDKENIETAEKIFREKYFVSEEKTELTKSVAAAEEKIIELSKPNSFSLYVSIPFCPTRCSYCSFVSHSMETATAKKLVPDYVRLLCEELKQTGEIAEKNGLHLESIYFGGGTPTTLEADELSMLFDSIRESFDLSGLREYTVEAGRPDTITNEKLSALISGGVNRISINPQTFNDEVLKNIGRKHSAELTKEKFCDARALGFDNINMDLIAGLPGDTYESFENSLNTALSLSPENITVHTLALKRASTLGTESGKVEIQKGILADKMLEYSYSELTKNGYLPYYMYRQSKTLNNLENTGYCKIGKECLYNIFMMEECHSVFAVGAGAVTKICEPSGKIKRIFNFKYPYEYISRYNIIRERKAKVQELLINAKE